MMPQDSSFLSDWVYPSSDSQSPASSAESFVLSPNYLHPSLNSETISNYLQEPAMNMACHQAEQSSVTSKRTRCKMIGPQRQNASEREKLRMRNLSKALHNLRRYLPPSVVPAGRNLTKIETLRLTISYISHLSQLLGLNEETMSQKREPQPESNVAYPKIPEGYQEVTCCHYQQNHQQNHQQGQSPICNELSYQRNNFRISSRQYNSRQQEAPWVSSLVCQRRNIPAADCSLPSPYTSRFTHTLHQVTEDQATNLHPSHLPYLRENDSCLRSNDPHFTFINGLQAS
ncbi:mesoderm posterior protein 1 [Leptodactylus fuscus]